MVITTMSSVRVNQECFLERENIERIEENFIAMKKYYLLIFHHTF